MKRYLVYSLCSLSMLAVHLLAPTSMRVHAASPTYSVDVQSAAVPGFISDGDILTPNGAGNFSPPNVLIPQPLIGFFPTPNSAELDALSYGTEPMLMNGPLVQHRWTFSVDEFAVGRPGAPGPSVTTEGAYGNQQAAADIYSTTLGAGPVAPSLGVNIGLFDGDGGFTLPFASQGLNLREPNPPTVNGQDAGDNLDAWDLDQQVSQGVVGAPFNVPIYYSLDSAFIDPLDFPNNTGTAQGNGFVGGDVLVSYSAGGPTNVFAQAFQLGLDHNGPDTDDLDALVLWENGDGLFSPSTAPYSWLNGLDDMLLFSVRRGSAVIGQFDSLQGLPIEEGDILMPPTVPGGLPGIFVTAESLGLATFRTNGTADTFQGHGDELDALDVQQTQVPEPGTLGMGALALLRMLVRRKRTAGL
ncbi:MAG: hypothetical protein KDA57_04580 [Planctomycetales bacterium]|nr:hypothetical protein [Planctomycetales bacterium]